MNKLEDSNLDASDSLQQPPQRIAQKRPRRNSIGLNSQSVLFQVPSTTVKRARQATKRPDLEQSAVDAGIVTRGQAQNGGVQCTVYRQAEQQQQQQSSSQFDPPMPQAEEAALPLSVRAMLKQRYVEQGGAQWRADRDRGITASMAAHALHAGFVPFTSALRFPASETALLERAGIIDRPGLDENGEQQDNESTAHGHKWESSAMMHCAIAERCNAICVGLLTHPQHRWLGASPDGVLVDGRLVEIKVPKRRPVKPGNPIPSYYWIQTQIQMAVCDAEQCIYYEFRPPSSHIKEIRTNVMHVKRDRAWFDLALPLFRAYLEHIVRMQRVAALFDN